MGGRYLLPHRKGIYKMLYRLYCNLYTGRKLLETVDLPGYSYQSTVIWMTDEPEDITFRIQKAILQDYKLVVYVNLEQGLPQRFYDINFIIVQPDSNWKVYNYEPVTEIPFIEAGIALSTGIVITGRDLSRLELEYIPATRQYVPIAEKPSPEIPLTSPLPFLPSPVSPILPPYIPPEKEKKPFPWWILGAAILATLGLKEMR